MNDIISWRDTQEGEAGAPLSVSGGAGEEEEEKEVFEADSIITVRPVSGAGCPGLLSYVFSETLLRADHEIEPFTVKPKSRGRVCGTIKPALECPPCLCLHDSVILTTFYCYLITRRHNSKNANV